MELPGSTILWLCSPLVQIDYERARPAEAVTRQASGASQSVYADKTDIFLMIISQASLAAGSALCKMKSAVAGLPAVLLLLATLTLTTATAQSTYTLLDRTTSFQTTPPHWSKRADVSIEQSETGYPQIKYQQHKRPAEGYTASASADESLYQVALVPGNGAVVGTELSEIKGQVVSVKNVRPVVFPQRSEILHPLHRS